MWFKDSIMEAVADGPIKRSMLLKAREEYGAVKEDSLRIFNGVIDIQLAVESAQRRIAVNSAKINKYVSKKAFWKYQHKYGPRTLDSCVSSIDSLVGMK